MDIRTIEWDYEYQMVRAIRTLLDDMDKRVEDFTPDALMDFVEDNQDELGRIVASNMFDWMEPNEWHSKVADK